MVVNNRAVEKAGKILLKAEKSAREQKKTKKIERVASFDRKGRSTISKSLMSSA